MLSGFLLFSCKTQNLFQTKNHGDLTDLFNVDEDYEYIIKTDDKISLSIWDHTDMSIGSVFSIYNSNEAFGKWVLVRKDSTVILPKVGKVKIGGLTRQEAAELIIPLYAKSIVDPIIVVKVLNREVTVLGEVRTAGKYILDKERNTLTEILGVSQGLQTYANMRKIQLIRGGVNYEIDLTKLDDRALYSIVVESGDVINVPSRNGKMLDQKAPTIIPLASALTAVALILTVIQK